MFLQKRKALLLRGTVASLMVLCLQTPAQADDIQDVSQLLRARQFDQALQRADSYLAGNPKDAQMRFLRALIFTEQGKLSEAITAFVRLSEEYPDLPEPYNNLAVLYASQGQFDKARGALETAIRTHPSYATAHENLGDVYAKLASQAYDKALQLDSSNRAAQTKLSLIRDLVGKAPSAPATPSAPAAGQQRNPPIAAVRPAATVPHSQAPAQVPVRAQAQAPGVASPAPGPVPSRPTPTQVVNSPAVNAVAPVPPSRIPPPVAAATANPLAANVAPPPSKSSEATVAASVQSVPSSVPSPSASGDVSSAVRAWATAWSSRDSNAYLAAYSADFELPKGVTRAKWEAERRSRIDGRSFISVTLDDIVMSVNGDVAIVRFRQNYKSDSLSTSGRKTLTLIKSNGKWLIKQERI